MVKLKLAHANNSASAALRALDSLANQPAPPPIRQPIQTKDPRSLMLDTDAQLEEAEKWGKINSQLKYYEKRYRQRVKRAEEERKRQEAENLRKKEVEWKARADDLMARGLDTFVCPGCTAMFDKAFPLVKHMDSCWSLKNTSSKYYTLERLVDRNAKETEDGTPGGVPMNVHRTKNVQGGNAKEAAFKSSVFPPADKSQGANFPNADGDYICSACSAILKSKDSFAAHTKTCWTLNNKSRRWDTRQGTYEVPAVSGKKYSSTLGYAG